MSDHILIRQGRDVLDGIVVALSRIDNGTYTGLLWKNQHGWCGGGAARHPPSGCSVPLDFLKQWLAVRISAPRWSIAVDLFGVHQVDAMHDLPYWRHLQRYRAG